jgi:hypothetical protein
MSKKRKLSLAIFAICLILVMAVSTFLIINPAGEKLSGVTEQVAFQSYVVVDVYRPVGGEMVLIYHDESSNVITNVGLHVIARFLSSAGTSWQWSSTTEGGTDKWYRIEAPRYIALSSDTEPADATNSSWREFDGSYSGIIEITTGGLQRATGTYTLFAYTGGTGTTKGSITYTLSKTFTVATGYSFDDVQKAGLFAGDYVATHDGLSSGNAIRPLVAENTFALVDLNAGDQIAVTWRITL